MSMTIAPQFLVAELPAAIDYYCSQLGFDQKINYEDFYASVIRDGAEIHLKCAERLVGAAEHRRDNNHIDAMIVVEDVNALHDEVKDRGAKILQPLTTQPWGNRDFTVLDPDGHIVCFSQEIS